MARDLAAFEKFHAENPEAYRLFSKFTFEVIAAGRTHFSAHAILHRIRWFTDFEAKSGAFKINDHVAPFFARMWMAENPKHKGFFETRDPSDPTVADAVPVGHDVPWAHPSYRQGDTTPRRDVLLPAVVDAPPSLPGVSASAPTPSASAYLEPVGSPLSIWREE
jgi:hypothetical protein